MGSLGWRFPRLSGRPLALVAIGAALAMILPGIASRLAASASSAPAPSPAAALQKAANPVSADLPLSFEANAGQTDAQVKFLARTRDYSLFLTPDKAVLSLAGNGTDKAPTAVYTNLLGANPAAKVTGASALPGTVNYLNNADPAQRHANVPTFARVAYAGVYPGVDLAYYGKASSLEYDFTVAPHADPSQIRMGIEGADSLRLDAAGNLVMATAAGEVTQHAPVLYQDIKGVRRPVQGSFTLTDNQVGFTVGPYDTSKPLVIDPTLAYSTFLDGVGNRIKVDNAGNAYVAGNTNRADFPTTPGALLRTFSNDFGASMAFVTKLSRGGSTVLYSTLVATTDGAVADLALIQDGSAWVMGENTFFQDVPVTAGAFLTDRLAGAAPFLVKLTPEGSGVSYGTYFANPYDSGRLGSGGLAVAANGDVWVTASAGNLPPDPPFPTTPGAIQSECDSDGFGGCLQNLIVAKIHPSGNGLADLAYSTFISGENMAPVKSPAIDRNGDVYVFGGVNGALATTPNALNPSPLGSSQGNGFLVKIHPAGDGPSDLLYSSYIGGSGGEVSGNTSAEMVLGPDGTVYLAFTTISFDIPVTPGAYQPFPRDNGNIALERLDTTKSGSAGLLYSSYVASDGNDSAEGLAVDGRGHMFVTGRAGFNFPARNPLACCPLNKGPGNSFDHTSQGDAFVLELNPAGHGDADLLFSTFLGGSTDPEVGLGIALAVDTAGRGRLAWVVGNAPSSDFPVTAGAYETTPGPGRSSFVSKIDFTDEIPCTRTLTGNVAGPVIVNAGEVVCINSATVGVALGVTTGGEVRIQNSRVANIVVSANAAAFTMCGTDVAGDVNVAGTAPVFITTTGPACAPNRITGTSNVPGGTTPGSTTTTVAPTTTIPATSTTTVPATTTTTRPSTTTTTVSSNCSAIRAQRQAYNAALTASEAGQSPATVAGMEQQRAARNAAYDRQLSSCAG